MNRYQNIPIIRNINGKQQYASTKYPEIPRQFSDLYVISTAEDRYDLLANQYYSDSTLWWVISIANGNFQQNSMVVPERQQVRIPVNISNILFNFERINQ